MRYREADRIVTLYTRDRGRIGAIAKGVRRTKSKVGGRLEPFSLVRASLYAGRGLYTIVGVETLPITLGEKRTLLLLKGVALFLGLFLIAAPLSGAVGPFSYLLLLTVLFSTLCLFVYERRWLHHGRRFEALVEGNFFLAGLLGLIWQGFV